MQNKLPYIIKQNSLGQDVLVTHNNQINLNKKNSSLNYQRKAYENCLDDLSYEVYEVNKKTYIIKSYNQKDNMCYIDVIDSHRTNIYSADDCNPLNISYNNNYITVWDMDYECPMINLLAAYDIKQQRLIDCRDIYTSNSLIDGVIKYRRCMFDVVASILLNKELMIDKTRLYSFMSFIVNDNVNQQNFWVYTDQIKSYILKFYPELKNIDKQLNQKDILKLNQQYGIDYFVFKQQDHIIPNIKYLSKKTYVKK